MDAMSLPFFLALCILPTSAQEPPREQEPLVYVVRLGDDEVGRETVRLTDEGWEAEGHFDFLGVRKADYRASLRHVPTGEVVYEFRTDDGGRARELRGVLESDTWTVRVPGTEKMRSFEVTGDRFVYDDLLWASFVDLGRWLTARADAGELSAGMRTTALSGAAAVGFPVEVVEVGARDEAGASYLLRLAERVDVRLRCDATGLPLALDVPSQRISVTAADRGVTPLEEEPRAFTLVDAGPWRAELSEPVCELTVERGVAVPMPDGATLVADVYRPVVPHRVPTILARTPYGRATEGALKGSWYAKRGYAFVAQDVRGRFDSGGEWRPFVHETADGSATLDWIAAREWSDGQVGMIGASYVGLVQWLAAKSGNPHLVCIAPQVSPPDPCENFPYEGGALMLAAAWWGKVLESMEDGKDWASGADWAKAYSTLPLGDIDEALGLERQVFLDEWLAHPPHDVDYWEPASYQGAFGRMSVPAFHVTGWWDGDQPGALSNFPGMRAGAATQRARAGQYLVVGPWTHFFNTSRTIGAVDYGEQAVVDLDARTLRFFDRYLKGIENGIDEEPPVLAFTMGTNRWHAEAGWPLPQTVFTPLYLSSGGDAQRLDGDGRLSSAPGAGTAARDAYRYDPLDLPPIDDLDFTDLSGAQATADQSHRAEREDDLEYLSPPLAAPCELMGPFQVVLWVTTDAADTDFVAELTRVTAAGEHLVMRGGVQRLRYATDPRRDTPATPGEVTRVAIDCWASGLRLERGDRVLLRVSSWAWPGYARNLNTLEPQATAERAVVATNVVLHDAEHPSHVLLPVVPREDAPGLSFEDAPDGSQER